MRRVCFIFLVGSLSISMIACSDDSQQKAPTSLPTAKAIDVIEVKDDLDNKANSQQPIPAGNLLAERIRFQYAIYCLKPLDKDPLEILESVLKAPSAFPEYVEKVPKNLSSPVFEMASIDNVQQDYAPLEGRMLERFGYGLTDEQKAALKKTTTAFILDFTHLAGDTDTTILNYQKANLLLEQLAIAMDGLAWDETTRELFSPQAWRQKRIENWESKQPDITNHTVMHAYPSDKHIRVITLGMQKFGRPDLVVQQTSRSDVRNTGNLINLLSQRFIENPVLNESGKVHFAIRDIKLKSQREKQLSSIKENAEDKIIVSLKMGRWEEGDPRNRLIELSADNYEGKDPLVRQQAMLAALFGWEDTISYIKHDEAILAASQKAKAKLPELRKHFQQALKPGELILVKAPFKTPEDSNEWMWVEVTKWEDKKITGILQNEPYHVPDLKPGQTVTVNMDDLFDYIHKLPDGTTLGNETGKLRQKQK